MDLPGRHDCARKQTDIGCGPCGGTGLIEGTTVLIGRQWRKIEEIGNRDRLRVDGHSWLHPQYLGGQTIWLDPVRCPEVVKPVQVPAGALGNTEPMQLQQNTRVMMRDRTLREAFGTTLVSLRAGYLPGFRGIELVEPPKEARLFELHLPRPAFIWAGRGARLLCLPRYMNLSTAEMDTPRFQRVGALLVRHLNEEEADAFVLLQESKPAAA